VFNPEILGSGASRTERLRQVVTRLGEIGPRNIYHYTALQEASEFCSTCLRDVGCEPVTQSYEARGKTFANISAEVPGGMSNREIVVVGAHYDSHKNSPGANDNGSALAVLFEVARVFAKLPQHRTLRLVAFTNEESPFTRTKDMGSRVYAKNCRERGDNIVAMLCLETLGCYSERPGTQRMSFGGWLLPREGNFLALVGNRRSKSLLAQATEVISTETDVRHRAVTLPTHFPGAWSSDHWSFWREGYPAIMATDTAPLRYRHYHSVEDTPDKVEFEWLTRVTDAIVRVVRSLCEANHRQS
jgi:Zn-dependent M28 family amino/carboxypeptidase